MSTTNTAVLIDKAQKGDKKAADELLTQNNGLIWSIVKRFLGRGVESEDLYQLGALGFVKAIQGFNIDFGTAFSTYAVPKITGEIRRFLRDDGRVKISRSIKELNVKLHRLKSDMENSLGRDITISELAEAAGVSVEEVAMCEQANISIDSLERELSDDGASLGELIGDTGIEEKLVTSMSLRNAICKLSDRERQIVTLRYDRGMTQTQTAKILGISQVQISRIEKKIVENLRKEIL